MSLRSVVLLAVGFAVATSFGSKPAQAIPPFLKEFQAKYTKPESEDPKDQEFAKLVNEATKCNVCHVKGKSKKERNAYGAELSKLLKKDQFKTDRLKAEPEKASAEIVAAFEEVAAKKSAGEDSPTFGELIVAYKLPGDVEPPKVADAPQPEKPEPMPETPAPPADAAPAGDAAEAIAAVEQLGGTVMQLAQDDDSLVVDFHLGGTALTDEGLAAVAKLPKVVQLHLKDTQITDAGLAQLANLATLNKLHLEQTKVTDAGLEQLGGLENLEYLNLYGTAVTDAGLEHLKGLKNLKKLFVWETQVSDEGIAKLKEALPEVTVVK